MTWIPDYGPLRLWFLNVFSRSVVSDSLQPHEPQHARSPCPSPTPGVHSKGIWFRSYLNGLVVFPTFFNLSLNLAIRSSSSEPYSALGRLLFCCWKRVFAMTSVFSWHNSVSLCPASFYTNLDSILKSRDIILLIKVCIVKAMVFPVVMYGRESWTIEKAECRRIDAFKL